MKLIAINLSCLFFSEHKFLSLDDGKTAFLKLNIATSTRRVTDYASCNALRASHSCRIFDTDVLFNDEFLAVFYNDTFVVFINWLTKIIVSLTIR